MRGPTHRPDVDVDVWGDGPSMLLLHPLGVDRTLWAPMRSLLPGFTTMALDLAGHGSAPTPAYAGTVEQLARDVAETLRALDCGPVLVVGVSLGGMVGQALAALHPDRVTGLVVADTVAVYPPAMQQMWRDRAVLVRECGMAPVVDPTIELWFTGEARAAEMPVVATTRSLLTSADPDGYAWACDLLASADTRGLLPAIKAPVLVVCGDEDAPAFTEAAPALAATVPDGRLSWLAGARHGAAFERPRELADLLMAFSADVRG